MKKSIILLLCVTLVLSFCACGKTSESQQPSAGMPNPVHECTEEELVQVTGIGLKAPEGAENAAYYYIDSEDAPISQVMFTLGKKAYCYRAQPVSATSLSGFAAENIDASAVDLSDELNAAAQAGASLAGYFGDWECAGLTDVAGSREGVFAFNDGKDGFIAWLDVVPGVMYSLSMSKGASQMLLQETAELCFVPLQGDA